MRGRPKYSLPTWSVGTEVRMVNCSEADIHAGRTWITRSEPWVLSGHTPVVMLEGYRGCFACHMLEVVQK